MLHRQAPHAQLVATQNRSFLRSATHVPPVPEAGLVLCADKGANRALRTQGTGGGGGPSVRRWRSWAAPHSPAAWILAHFTQVLCLLVSQSWYC